MKIGRLGTFLTQVASASFNNPIFSWLDAENDPVLI